MAMNIFAAALVASAIALPTIAVAQDNDIVVMAQKGRVETAVFGKRPFVRDPRLSPDGTKVAVMMSRNGVDNLVYIDLTKAGSPPTLIAKAEEYREAGDRTMAAWRWVGNRTLIVTLLSREIIFGQRSDLRRLAAFDLETGKLTPIAWTDAGGDGGTILHVDDEKETILVQRGLFKDGSFSPGPEVIDVDVRTGRYRTIQRPNVEVNNWLVDGKGVVRGGLGQDDKGNQRLMYRSDASETIKTVSNAKDPTFTQSQIVPSVFLDEPDMAYATSNKDNLRRVYKVNMKAMEIVGPPPVRSRRL